MVKLVLLEHDDTGDLGADGNNPGERGEQAKALGGGLLALRRFPVFGDVDICARIGVRHVRNPPYRPSTRAGSGRETWATARSVFKTLFANNVTDVAGRDQQ
jgi:hypothetical protein